MPGLVVGAVVVGIDEVVDDGAGVGDNVVGSVDGDGGVVGAEVVGSVVAGGVVGKKVVDSVDVVASVVGVDSVVGDEEVGEDVEGVVGVGVDEGWASAPELVVKTVAAKTNTTVAV